MRKFTRAVKGGEKATDDNRGRIVVQVGLRTPKGGLYVKGNITRYLTIKDAKVSEVITAIAEALFEDEEGENQYEVSIAK